MGRQRIAMTFLSIALLLLFSILPTQAPAQAQGGGWSKPYRLSSEAGAASEGYLVADQYGYVHCFWSEALFEEQRTVIKYARFDGTTWTKPNDIYVTGQEIRNISPFIDQQGMLYIAWAEGQSEQTYYTYYYTYAPVNNAISVQNWAIPLKTVLPARTVYMRVDPQGIFHVLYIDQTEAMGVYYMRSEDQGTTWSQPVWLDPDILPDHIPDSLSFEVDESGGLHAAWWYGGLNRSRPDWIRYTHSLDGGHTWSTPLILDRYDEASDHNLTVASPRMIVQGQNVHVIWAAGNLPYRYHRFSTDAGRTWSTATQIFGELHGQAFDGLAVDRAGRVHFFGQIRYPMGIYHASWDQTRWSRPELVYLIAEIGEEDDFGDRVHAHNTLPVIRAGNQIVLTFGDSPSDPNRRLFVMHRTLDDISPLENMPTPMPSVTPVSLSSATPEQTTPLPNRTPIGSSPGSEDAEPLAPAPAPDLAIRVALVPTLIILGVAMVFQLYKRRR